MSSSVPLTARAVAASVLTRADPKKGDVVETLADFLRRTKEPQRATDIVFGVLKNNCLIDNLIKKVSAVPVGRISGKILNILRVGVYELVYCPQAAEYAIVDEAVDYSKRVAGAKQAGFVNAVLRQVLRHIRGRQKTIEQSQLRETILQTPDTGCEFDLEILPDPKESPLEYLGCAFSLPRWLVSDWLRAFGPERTRNICFASNRRPSVYLRPNLLKTTAGELAEKLKSADVECEIEPESQMIKLTSPKAITSLPGFNDGLFTVQDLAASEVVRALKPKPDWTILDLCAAPGTKTTQLAEATGGRAKIVATDIDSGRLKKVKENIARLGSAGCVTTIEYNDVEKQGGFDCVLVDAPCSNTGVLARRPEVRYRITKSDVKKLAKTQMMLLSKAAGMLKPKGVICYSTCSIQPEEDGLLVRRFIEGNPGFELESERLILPSADMFDRDGSYTAIIVRRAGD
ncbi:MAG: transcription antitermination factor NusB [Sedimentisphaerales bacterium]|jgi:16S rRNA (cytosine967-C5)-methyltransferase